MNIQNCTFLRSAASQKDFPKDNRPQIVLAGRSNVGKSSVINCLLGRRSMARVSASPGKTANINLFDIDHQMYLVDLPGYGFAKVSAAEKARWGKLMDTYFSTSQSIALVISIVDLRHDPSADDCSMVDYLRQRGLPFAICANKADKLKKSEIEPHMEAVRQVLELNDETAVVFSAEKGTGKQELWNTIFSAIDAYNQTGRE